MKFFRWNVDNDSFIVVSTDYDENKLAFSGMVVKYDDGFQHPAKNLGYYTDTWITKEFDEISIESLLEDKE